MNIALIFAGGTGQRMKSTTLPKQFLELHGKPIIIYTLEQFEFHPMIDSIIVVCLAGWESFLEKKIKKFDINKVCCIVPGGKTGQLSIFNGVNKAKELFDDDDILLIHDGVRPLIDAETITNNIECAKNNGCAITVSPTTETVVLSQNATSDQIESIVERDCCRIAKAPQSFRIKDIYAAHLKAKNDGKDNFIDSASLMNYYKYPLFTVDGTVTNIKITTPTDFYIFRAIMDAKEDQQIMGV